MFQGRRLCEISLLFVLFIAFNVYGPWDMLGVYDKAKAIDTIAEDCAIEATGTIYHKEIKYDQVLYYVKNGSLEFDSGRIDQISFLFKYNSDTIPNYSKINIKGKMRHFDPARNEGAFDEKSYYNSLGLLFEMSNPKPQKLRTNLFTKNDFMYRLSMAINNVYLFCLDGEEAGFLSSIAIGNKSSLEGQLKDLFKFVGLAHVLAVSGLHVSIICMAIYRLLRNRGLSFIKSGIAAAFLAVNYGFLTGGSVSSIRAIGMFLVFLLADITGNCYDSLTALALLADILLLENPLFITNGSFIFSFGAILSINYISLPLSRRFLAYCSFKHKLKKSDYGFYATDRSLKEKLFEYIVGSFIFSYSIYVAMLPLVANMYYETPVFSVVLNLLVLPLMPVLLIIGLLGGCLGLVCMPLAMMILQVCHFIIFSFEWLANMFLMLPYSNIIIGKHNIVFTIIYYILLYGIVNWDITTLLKKITNIESSYARTSNPRRILSGIKRDLLIKLLGAFLVSLIIFVPTKLGFEVDILDVGQGDGIFISSGDGVNFFIDGGSTTIDEVAKYNIYPVLKSKGVRRIDYWFLSHMDLDHVSGVMEILEDGYNIKNIVLSSEIPDGETLDKLLDLAHDNHTNIIYMKKGDVCGTKHLRFKCLYPFVGAKSDDINALSLSLLMEYDKNLDSICDYSAFFGGDIGINEESQIAKLPEIGHVDLLKVSHHGSKGSSAEDFLEKLSPEYAVISCAKKNRYGHPADEAIKRIDASGAMIFYTMNQGEISFSFKGDGVDIRKKLW